MNQFGHQPSLGVFDTKLALGGAIRLHQAGQIVEAEALYRRILAVAPDNVDALHLLGMLSSQTGQHRAAIELIGRAIALSGQKPVAEFHNNIGLAFRGFGQFDEAIRHFNRVIELKPGNVEAFNNLGGVLQMQGRLDESIACYRRAIELRPDYANAYRNLGIVLQQTGKLDDAAACCERVLSLMPGDAEAHNTMGIVLQGQGKLDEAASRFERALSLDPDNANAHYNLGNVLKDRGELDAAAASYERALALAPDDAAVHNNLGNVQYAQGKLDEAEKSCRRALALMPDYADAHKNLGSILCRQDRIDEAFESFMRGAAHRYRKSIPRAPKATAPHRLQHDREQLDYLVQNKTSNPAIRRVHEALQADRESASRFGQLFNGIFHIEGGGRVADAVNPGIDTIAAERRWDESQPNIVVVDDLLTPEAIDALRRYCWGSTIWRRTYRAGYLGTFLGEGFSCPLLAQIALELRAKLPGIVRGYPLTQCWAFKYDSRLKGINIHADGAAVNVNFWITPDDANLDANRGGLVVWDQCAPFDWDFDQYNGNEQEIREFLSRAGAKPVVIPYRANRAVIFDSNLFHETDRIDFREGYCNRRINVTMLYGLRQTA